MPKLTADQIATLTLAGVQGADWMIGGAVKIASERLDWTTEDSPEPVLRIAEMIERHADHVSAVARESGQCEALNAAGDRCPLEAIRDSWCRHHHPEDAL